MRTFSFPAAALHFVAFITNVVMFIAMVAWLRDGAPVSESYSPGNIVFNAFWIALNVASALVALVRESDA